MNAETELTSVPARRDLAIVTVALHYPLTNPRERIIVTAPDSEEGALCQRRLLSDEELFHAAWCKSSWINIGLDSIDDSVPWAAVVDADVVITQSLLDRILACLEYLNATGDSLIFGLCGRRSVTAAPVREDEPRSYLQRNRTIIGYFQAFRAHRKPCRYPTSPTQWGKRHDDWAFYNLFGWEKAVALPFSCYHVGQSSRDWGGYTGTNPLTDDNAVNAVAPAGAAFSPLLSGGKVLALNVLGAKDTIDLVTYCGVELLYAFDEWELNQNEIRRVEDLPSRFTGIAGWIPGKWNACRIATLKGERCPPVTDCVTSHFLNILKIDREFTRRRYLDGISKISERVRLIGEPAPTSNEVPIQSQNQALREPNASRYQNGGLNEIEDNSLSAIWISGEVDYSQLLTDLAKLLPKLDRENGFFCGRYHDIVNWPESTMSIEMLIGTPDVVTVDGQWMIRIHRCSPSPKQPSWCDGQTDAPDPVWPTPLPLTESEFRLEKKSKGIVFYLCEATPEDIEQLIVSIHSLRHCWQREVAVLNYGEEQPSIRIICARYGVAYLNLPMEEEEGDPRMTVVRKPDPYQQINKWTPYRSTLWLEARQNWDLSELSDWDRQCGPSDVTSICRLPHNPSRDDNSMRKRAQVFEVLSELAVTVRVRRDATVVIPLTPQDMFSFERNWTAAKWQHAAATLDEAVELMRPDPVRIILACFDVAEREVEVAMRHRSKDLRRPQVRLVEMSARNLENLRSDLEPYWVSALAACAPLVETNSLILLDAMLNPLPGAELFLPHRLRGAPVAAPGWAFKNLGLQHQTWHRRVFDAFRSPFESVTTTTPPFSILKHLRLGPSATLIQKELLLISIKEWSADFSDMPFEIYLTLRQQAVARISGQPQFLFLETCRPQDWGWRA